jgi:hypothetical protein
MQSATESAALPKKRSLLREGCMFITALQTRLCFSHSQREVLYFRPRFTGTLSELLLLKAKKMCSTVPLSKILFTANKKSSSESLHDLLFTAKRMSGTMTSYELLFAAKNIQGYFRYHLAILRIIPRLLDLAGIQQANEIRCYGIQNSSSCLKREREKKRAHHRTSLEPVQQSTRFQILFSSVPFMLFLYHKLGLNVV